MKREIHICPILMKTVEIDRSTIKCMEECYIKECPLLLRDLKESNSANEKERVEDGI